MRKVLIFILLFSFSLFGQTNYLDNLLKSNTISVHPNFHPTTVDSHFTYFKDENFKLDLNDFAKLQNAVSYNKKQFESTLKNQHKRYKLWLKTNLINTSADTLQMVLNIKYVDYAKIYFVGNGKIAIKYLGFKTNTNQRDFKIDDSSLTFTVLPNETKAIYIESEFKKSYFEGVTIKLELLFDYNENLINLYQSETYIYLLFTFLTGGVFIMLLYNILLYFQYKENVYIYYSLHLFFTLLNYLIMSDSFNQDFFGIFSPHRYLILENTYVLSFIFYAVFMYYIFDNNNRISLKKWFQYCVGFMVLYFIAVNIISQIESSFINNNFLYFGLVFRVITITYVILMIYQILKLYRNSHLKYIAYGSLILTIGYLMHVVSNLIIGKSIVNHFYNLVGSIIEILFFTYALNLRKRNAELERDILIKINTLKSRFFANISHEFRTPLTLIKSPIQSLQSSEIDETQRNQLHLIDKNADRMLELVNQLLQLSKIDSGSLKLILKEENAGHFLNSIIESFEFQAKENKINFISRIEKNAQNHYLDKDIIEKIVANLLTNAFKYTPEEEQISFISTIENENLKLIVMNSGSNLKKEELPKLFERFYQKDDSQHGFGIGLALIKELVDLCKGKLETTLENSILSFIITIPLQQENSNALTVTAENQTEIIPNTFENNDLPLLLIVDDNADLRNVIKVIFKEDFTILEAENGEKALKIAQKEIPDCIISDVMMPKMNGFELTKAIKNNELTSFIPMVLLTAKTSEEAHLEGLQSTADAFLTKPFNHEILKATVKQLHSERKKLQEHYSRELVLKPVHIVINSIDEKFLEKLQIILNKELSNADFTTDEFANQIAMSRMQLHRKLKTLLGVSATEFLRNERLKTASILLKEGNSNISEIAYSVGYNNISYFTRSFKDRFDVTPSEYINKS